MAASDWWALRWHVPAWWPTWWPVQYIPGEYHSVEPLMLDRKARQLDINNNIRELAIDTRVRQLAADTGRRVLMVD